MIWQDGGAESERQGEKKRGRLEGPSRVRRVRTKTLILQWSRSESMPRNACVSGHHWEDRAWHAPSTITFNSHRHKGPNLPQGFHMVLSLPTLSEYLDVFSIKCYRVREHFRTFWQIYETLFNDVLILLHYFYYTLMHCHYVLLYFLLVSNIGL